jgi:hypothetical protein
MYQLSSLATLVMCWSIRSLSIDPSSEIPLFCTVGIVTPDGNMIMPSSCKNGRNATAARMPPKFPGKSKIKNHNQNIFETFLIKQYNTHRVRHNRDWFMPIRPQRKIIQKIGQGRRNRTIVFGAYDDKSSGLVQLGQQVGHPDRSSALVRHEVIRLLQQRSVDFCRI